MFFLIIISTPYSPVSLNIVITSSQMIRQYQENKLVWTWDATPHLFSKPSIVNMHQLLLQIKPIKLVKLCFLGVSWKITMTETLRSILLSFSDYIVSCTDSGTTRLTQQRITRSHPGQLAMDLKRLNNISSSGHRNIKLPGDALVAFTLTMFGIPSWSSPQSTLPVQCGSFLKTIVCLHYHYNPLIDYF